MATVARLTNFIFDSLLELEDGAAAITVDGAGSAILNLGGNVYMTGDVVIDISALTTGGAADETYTIIAEFSDSATFASGIESGAAMLVGGAGAALGGRDVVTDIGRYVLPVNNQLNTRLYQYMRLFVDVTGTAPSITFFAWLSKAKTSVGD